MDRQAMLNAVWKHYVDDSQGPSLRAGKVFETTYHGAFDMKAARSPIGVLDTERVLLGVHCSPRNAFVRPATMLKAISSYVPDEMLSINDLEQVENFLCALENTHEDTVQYLIMDQYLNPSDFVRDMVGSKWVKDEFLDSFRRGVAARLYSVAAENGLKCEDPRFI